MPKGLGLPFTFKGRCLSCNKIMLYEPEDKIPWCDECRDRRQKEFQKKIRPDLEEEKMEIISEVYEVEREQGEKD